MCASSRRLVHPVRSETTEPTEPTEPTLPAEPTETTEPIETSADRSGRNGDRTERLSQTESVKKQLRVGGVVSCPAHRESGMPALFRRELDHRADIVM